MPNFELVIEKAPKKPEAAKKPEAGKKEESKKGGDAKKVDAKKADKPKQEKKKEAPKKEAAKPAPVAAPVVAKWTPPELKFVFYDFKTELCNSKDIKTTLEKLYSAEMWDEKGLSFWLLQYEKFNEKEGA